MQFACKIEMFSDKHVSTCMFIDKPADSRVCDPVPAPNVKVW